MALIAIHEFSRLERRTLQDKLFKALLKLNMILIVLDAMGHLLNGKAGIINKLLNYTVNTFSYIITPLPLLLWVFYVDYMIFQSEKRIKKENFYLFFPILINAILVLLSPFKGLIFFIDDKNFYHRGPLFIFLAAICYLFILLSIVIILLNKSKIGSKKFISMLVYPLPILIGGILQNIFYGISTIWIGSTTSILILYFSIQSSRLNTDYLTGLYNRRQLDNYLKSKIRNSSIENSFAGILIDLDDFKSINDVFGHNEGDEALLSTANLLKKCFPKNALIVRYAGDEFVIIKDISKPENLKTAIDKLNTFITNYNLRTDKPYKLKLSMGYAVYDHKSRMGAEEFIKHIDSLMYEEKKIKKKLMNKSILQEI